MNKFLLVLIVLLTQFAAAEPRGITSSKQCEASIAEEYSKKKYYVYRIQALRVGRGKYATHFNYEIKYIRDKENPYTEEGCIAKVHCADYHFDIVTDVEYCGS